MPPVGNADAPVRTVDITVNPTHVDSFELIPDPIRGVDDAAPVSTGARVISLVYAELDERNPVDEPTEVSPAAYKTLRLQTTGPGGLTLEVVVTGSQGVRCVRIVSLGLLWSAFIVTLLSSFFGD